MNDDPAQKPPMVPAAHSMPADRRSTSIFYANETQIDYYFTISGPTSTSASKFIEQLEKFDNVEILENVD